MAVSIRRRRGMGAVEGRDAGEADVNLRPPVAPQRRAPAVEKRGDARSFEPREDAGEGAVGRGGGGEMVGAAAAGGVAVVQEVEVVFVVVYG